MFAKLLQKLLGLTEFVTLMNNYSREIKENRGRTNVPPVPKVKGAEKGNKRKRMLIETKKENRSKNFSFHTFCA
jgi:hypothetical protein